MKNPELKGTKHFSNLIGLKMTFLVYKIQKASELNNFHSTINKLRKYN